MKTFIASLVGVFAVAFMAILASVPAGAQVTVAPQGGVTGIIAIPQGGSTPYKYFSAATNNSTSVIAGSHTIYLVRGFSTNATAAYLKLYDKATAPTCGTDTPGVVVPLIQNVASTIEPAAGIAFSSGVGFCIVANQADNDNTSATTGITVQLLYK